MVAILAVCIGVVLFAYVAFASAISGAVHNEPTTLRQTIFVFRHGDRSPTETYPKDPYKNYEWPGGWGALAKVKRSK